jgi:hypothetical protein
VRTGARRLEHRLGEEIAPVEQLAARERQVAQREVVALVVAPTHLADGEVAQQLRPGLLGIADAHSIGILHRLLRHQRDMRAAEHHRNAVGAIVPRQLVAARRAAGDDGDADESAARSSGTSAMPSS